MIEISILRFYPSTLGIPPVVERVIRACSESTSWIDDEKNNRHNAVLTCYTRHQTYWYGLVYRKWLIYCIGTVPKILRSLYFFSPLLLIFFIEQKLHCKKYLHEKLLCIRCILTFIDVCLVYSEQYCKSLLFIKININLSFFRQFLLYNNYI